ncbi:MAG: BrnA antitoxin family protein [Mogibacterium sp.]|nr:BrnA antitoxin family protein [Mogibacterium sp.]
MRTTKVIIKPGDEPSKEAIEEVNKAAERPITFDDDSPRFTKDQMREMADKARARRGSEKKPVVAIRVSPNTLELARATGKGYTGFLSRLLDLAINDADMVQRALNN